MLCNEFDPDRKAVINPEDHFEPVPGFPEICVGIFSDVILRELVEKYRGELLCELHSCSGNMPVYRLTVEDTEIALMLPFVGGPSAIACIEEIFPRGGKYFVFAGAAGVLRHDIADRHLIVPTAAVRDEGLSYHYLPPSDQVELDPENVEACRQALDSLGLPWAEGKTWTTDAIYRETRRNADARRKDGCLTVEMECASVMAVGQFRQIPVYQFLYTEDSLDGGSWERRTLGSTPKSDYERHLRIALETAIRL